MAEYMRSDELVTTQENKWFWQI